MASKSQNIGLIAEKELVIDKIFSNLCMVLVNKSGGAYVFAKDGFGDFIGFYLD